MSDRISLSGLDTLEGLVKFCSEVQTLSRVSDALKPEQEKGPGLDGWLVPNFVQSKQSVVFGVTVVVGLVLVVPGPVDCPCEEGDDVMIGGHEEI